MAGPESRRFVSLRWQTLAWVSAALTAIHVALVWQGYADAMDQYRERQARTFATRLTVLGKLLDQSYARLGRIAATVPGVMNVTQPGADFPERWQGVQLELHLEIMQLYRADGRIHVAGLPLWKEPPAALQERITAALRDEKPSGFLLCAPECLQYALTPMLIEGGQPGLMVLGVSLADVVLEFPELAGADVALLVPDGGGAEGRRYWGQYRLAAISDAPRNEPKVAALEALAGLAALEQGHNLAYQDRDARFYAAPLSRFTSATPGYFLVFADTTEALADIRNQLRRQLLTGLAALLAALALLLWILSRPMNRLRTLAETLPMLARSQYGPARQRIGQGYLRTRTRTEIEVLEGASVDLSRRLEALEQTLASRNQALAEKIAELKRAHELNQRIFETAPLVFLLQSQDGRVLQINSFGSQLLGYGETEMQGLLFVSLLADARQRAEAGDGLADVVSGRRPLIEQTGAVKCVDGSLERITWLHTRLPSPGGNLVLSVGLPDKSVQMPVSLATN